jgi:hypothetical protein
MYLHMPNASAFLLLSQIIAALTASNAGSEVAEGGVSFTTLL